MIRYLRGMLILLLFLSLFPVRAQEAGAIACEYDLTGKTIKFYYFGDLSGVYTFITLPVVAGFEDAIEYLNANGGICGAEIIIESRDTAGDREAAQAAWDDFSSRDDANVIIVILTEDSELLREQAEEKKIPIIASTGSVKGLYGDNGDDPGWVFAVTPLYEDQLGAFCDYISENWARFGIEGDPVIGHVSWLGAVGEASDRPETRAYCESIGVGYAGAAYFFPGLPDITTQVQTILDKGANIIYTTSLASGPAQVATTLETLGMQGKVLVAGPNWVIDTSVIRLGGEATAGIIGQLPYRWWDELSHPGVQIVTQKWAEKRLVADPEGAFELRNIAYLLAWAAADLYNQIITASINHAGGLDNLDGTAVYETLTSGMTFSGLDGLLSFSFDETRRSPNLTRMGTIEFLETDAGLTPQVTPLTEWVETPDLKPGGADVP